MVRKRRTIHYHKTKKMAEQINGAELFVVMVISVFQAILILNGLYITVNCTINPLYLAIPACIVHVIMMRLAMHHASFHMDRGMALLLFCGYAYGLQNPTLKEYQVGMNCTAINF